MRSRIVPPEYTIHVPQLFGMRDFRSLLEALHHAYARWTRDLRRKQHELRRLAAENEPPPITIDFSSCRNVGRAAMAAVIADVARIRQQGGKLTVALPTYLPLRNAFLRLGWAHYLDPAQFEHPAFEQSQIPLLQFGNEVEQGEVVNRLVEHVLRSTRRFAREDFSAVEWAINEITDNVLLHSESPVGGFVHLSISEGSRRSAGRRQHRVDLIVADAGLGIPRTLRKAVAPITDDRELLDQAIRRRITRDPAIGQGNGLYGSYRIAEGSGGALVVHAGGAALRAARGEFDLHSEHIQHTGTLVVASMDYSQPNMLARALDLPTSASTLTDRIEREYEVESEGTFTFDLSREAESFGSRASGKRVRTKLANLYRLGRDRMGRPVRIISIDLSNVAFLSSSFADEAFGKLLLEFGNAQFQRAFRVENGNPTVEQLVNKAILQRAAEMRVK